LTGFYREFGLTEGFGFVILYLIAPLTYMLGGIFFRE